MVNSWCSARDTSMASTPSLTAVGTVWCKNKWGEGNAANGGWQCGHVYFYFADDLTKHVCELQMVHTQMQTIRKEIPAPAYKQYGSSRAIGQLISVAESEADITASD